MNPSVITAWGQRADAALASCGAVNCALKDGGYCALSGAIAKYAVVHIDEARERGCDRSIVAALAGRHRRARAVRMTAIGDVAATPGLVSRALEDVARIDAVGLEVIGYTHGWRLSWGRPLRATLRASCDDLAEADEAAAAGWLPQSYCRRAPIPGTGPSELLPGTGSSSARRT